jgi:Family of unknown function (DUF6510)
MDLVDGNAIAGTLFAVFGREMTTATARCASCAATRLVGELHVYLRGPGAVVRCPRCENVLMVIVEARGVACVDLRGLAALQPAR